jgi:hypothetical protein
VAQVLQLALNPSGAPGLVLAGDLDDKLLDLFGDPLPAWRPLLFPAVIFAGNESPMPMELLLKEDARGNERVSDNRVVPAVVYSATGGYNKLDQFLHVV